MASPSPMFEKTMHLRSRWIRADFAEGAFAVGAVSAYVAGFSSFAGRTISSPHGAADIAFTGVAVPQSVTLDREEIWLLADHLERKPDGDYRRSAGHMPRIASHFDGALPWGLTEEAARRIVEGFSRWVVDTYGVAVEFAAHNSEKPLDHAHFLIGTRVLTKDGFGKKVRAMNGIAQRHADRQNGKEIAHQRADGTIKRVSSAMDEIRARWAELVTAEIGHVVDHRSYERRGLDIVPVPRIRRGEIEFQKRVERRTGVAPEWRKDRARRMAARARTPMTVAAVSQVALPNHQNGGALLDIRRSPKRAHAVTPVTSTAIAAARHIARLRNEIVARGATANDRHLAISRGDDAQSHLTTARDNFTVERSGSSSVGSTRWRLQSDEILSRDGDERAALIERHAREKGALQRKQRVVLTLVEKLVEHDALVALVRLAECARRFADQAKALGAAHDEQWLKLFATQSLAWRAAADEEVKAQRPASGKTDALPDAPAVSTDASHDPMRTRRRREPSVPTGQHMANAFLESLRKRVDISLSSEREAWRVQANDDDADRISQGRSEIRLRAFQAGQRKDDTVAAPDATFEKMADGFCTRWQERVLAALAGQNRARDDMLVAQEMEESNLRRRQNLTLALLERMIALDALLAMYRLFTAARRFALETHALLEKQGQDWLDLVSAHRKAWPSLPLSRDTVSPVNSAMPESGSLPERALALLVEPAGIPRGQDEVGRARSAASATRTKPPLRPEAHVRIVEEIADWLVLRNARSAERNLVLAAYLGETAKAFDDRTNQRKEAALEQARALGPGQQAMWAPRSPKEILLDPIVGASANLRELILQVGTRSKSPTLPRQHEIKPVGISERAPGLGKGKA